MASSNQFDLLGDVENDDPAHLLAAAEKKAAAVPKPAPAPAKLPTKPPPPAQPGEPIAIRFRCRGWNYPILRSCGAVSTSEFLSIILKFHSSVAPYY
jgi:hypothetical protein